MSKNQLRRDISPQMGTFVLQISNPKLEIDIETGFYGEHSITFLDDVYSTYNAETMTIEQADEIKDVLYRVDQSPELLELIVACDTGYTSSAAIAQYVKETYPKAVINQKIDKKKLNRHVLSTLRISNCRGVRPYGTDAIAANVKEFGNDVSDLVKRTSQRSLIQNASAFKNWFRDNF